MTDAQATTLQSVIQAMIRSLDVRADNASGTPRRWPVRTPPQFQSLVKLLQNDPQLVDIARAEDFVTTSAVCAVGPQGAIAPPIGLRTQFYAIAGGRTLDEIFDSAVLFAWYGQRCAAPEPWDHKTQWWGALEALTTYAEGPVRQSFSWLRSLFGVDPDRWAERGAELEYARAVAISLIHFQGPTE